MSEAKEGLEAMKENVDALKGMEGTTDELLGGDPDLETSDDVGGDEPEYSDIELKAMEKGWSPDKEDLPEGKEWVDAGEFLRNEKFFAEIHKLKREQVATQQAFEALKEHHRKVAEVERQNILEQLKMQKKAALEEDDHDAVVEIDEEIAEVKATSTDIEGVDMAQANVAFEAWVDKNPWYDADVEMRQTADEIGAAYYVRTGQKAQPEEIYKYVEDRIKVLYKDKFGGTTAKPKRKQPAAVEGAQAGRKRGGAKKFTAKDLSPDQRRVMNTFIKQGAITEEQYIDDLVKIGELY